MVRLRTPPKGLGTERETETKSVRKEGISDKVTPHPTQNSVEYWLLNMGSTSLEPSPPDFSVFGLYL